jgi:hypothetical protein
MLLAIHTAFISILSLKETGFAMLALLEEPVQIKGSNAVHSNKLSNDPEEEDTVLL